MISPPYVFTKRYKRITWKRNRVQYLLLASFYPCGDMPTDDECRSCPMSVPCRLRRSIKRSILVPGETFIINNSRRPGRGFSHLVKTKDDLRRLKECDLPGCPRPTVHRGGYCCADHKRLHTKIYKEKQG